MTVETHNDWHLGDNLIHLNFLRRVAQQMPNEKFIHAAKGNYLPQLYEVVDDLPNIELIELSQRSAKSIDCWKNRKGDFYNHPKRNDWVQYHLEFFDGLARDLGVINPILVSDDLLFDYPAIGARACGDFDVLIVNSEPQSNQLRNIGYREYETLIGILIAHNRQVATTAPTNRPEIPCTINLPLGRTFCSVTDIGTMSLHCKLIIGCVTGPMWPTLNVKNKTLPRILLLSDEYIKIPSMVNTYHAAEVEKVLDILFSMKLL